MEILAWELEQGNATNRHLFRCYLTDTTFITSWKRANIPANGTFGVDDHANIPDTILAATLKTISKTRRGYTLSSAPKILNIDFDEEPVKLTTTIRRKLTETFNTTNPLPALQLIQPTELNRSTGIPVLDTAIAMFYTGETTPTTATVQSPGPQPRANGTHYLPRQLSTTPDVEALRNLRQSGIHVLLYGPPGTGKTAMVEAAHPDLITVSCTEETEPGDLIGSYTPTPGGTYQWCDGPLVNAMREGRPLFLDDVTLAPARALAAVYPAMDGRSTITVTGHNNETVTAQPGFVVIGAHNPGVPGAVLSEALSSRFSLHTYVGTDYTLARSLGVPSEAIRLARNLNQQLNSGEVTWAPQLRELLGYKAIKATLGTQAAAANLVSIAPEFERPNIAQTLSNILGTNITELCVGPQLLAS